MWILCLSGKKNISRLSARNEIMFVPLEHNIHIFELTCNLIFIIWTIDIHCRDWKAGFDTDTGYQYKQITQYLSYI